MKRILLALTATFICLTSSAKAQTFFANTKSSVLSFTHSTVGTTTADAISSSSVGGNVISWKICNDAVNTSTYLLVGQAADAATDGVMLDKGQCFECPNCRPATLKLMKVKAQAASNGYSVIQYK